MGNLDRRGALIGLAVLAVLAAGVFAAVYLTMFNPARVAAVSLPSPAATPVSGALVGNWKVTTGSFVGYRVREQLAQLPAPSDAVGRTSAVTGDAVVTTNPDGTASVSSIKVTADLTQLSSDSGRRDNYVRQNSLETSQFPQTTFVSGAAFPVPAPVVTGAAGSATVTGKLTIHGVTRDVSIPLKIQRSGTSVNVVGSYQFHWGDYGVQQPQVPVASVQSDPTIEVSLVLTTAA